MFSLNKYYSDQFHLYELSHILVSFGEWKHNIRLYYQILVKWVADYVSGTEQDTFPDHRSALAHSNVDPLRSDFRSQNTQI